MYTNHGFENEANIEKAFHGKKFKDLNPNLKAVATKLFGELSDDDEFECHQTNEFIKPDIVLSCKGKDCFISIKFERSIGMHMEFIDTFVNFLRSINISENTIDTILLYQFGDGTKDGSGGKRMNYGEIFKQLESDIAKANYELNDHLSIINQVIDRVIFQGVDPVAEPAEYIYVGTVESGQIISKKQVKSLLRNKNWHYYDNLHIGPIMLRPHARYSNKTIVSEKSRRQIICYWARFVDDVSYMAKRYYF